MSHLSSTILFKCVYNLSRFFHCSQVRIILFALLCHLPITCRSLVDWCGSFGSCKSQIYFFKFSWYPYFSALLLHEPFKVWIFSKSLLKIVRKNLITWSQPQNCIFVTPIVRWYSSRGGSTRITSNLLFSSFMSNVWRSVLRYMGGVAVCAIKSS